MAGELIEGMIPQSKYLSNTHATINGPDLVAQNLKSEQANVIVTEVIATNELLYTDVLTNGVWSHTATAATSAEFGPNGIDTCHNVTVSSPGQYLQQSIGSVNNGTTVYFSVWLKRATAGTATIKITAGAQTATLSCTLENFWNQFSTSLTLTSTVAVTVRIEFTDTNILVYGPMANLTSRFTLYISSSGTKGTYSKQIGVEIFELKEDGTGSLVEETPSTTTAYIVEDI